MSGLRSPGRPSTAVTGLPGTGERARSTRSRATATAPGPPDLRAAASAPGRAATACSPRASTRRTPRPAPPPRVTRRPRPRRRTGRSPTRSTPARRPRDRRQRRADCAPLAARRAPALPRRTRRSEVLHGAHSEVPRRRTRRLWSQATISSHEGLADQRPPAASNRAESSRAARRSEPRAPRASARRAVHDGESVELRLLGVVCSHVPGERLGRVRGERVALPVGEVREPAVLERQVERASHVAVGDGQRLVRPGNVERGMRGIGNRVDELHLARHRPRRPRSSPGVRHRGAPRASCRPSTRAARRALAGRDRSGARRSPRRTAPSRLRARATSRGSRPPATARTRPAARARAARGGRCRTSARPAAWSSGGRRSPPRPSRRDGRGRARPTERAPLRVRRAAACTRSRPPRRDARGGPRTPPRRARREGDRAPDSTAFAAAGGRSTESASTLRSSVVSIGSLARISVATRRFTGSYGPRIAFGSPSASSTQASRGDPSPA